MAGKTPPVGATGPSLFDLFYGLASEARAQRIAAASALTSKALAAQADFEAAARVAQGGDGAAAIASDVQYTLSRLVKGLSSGRAAARPGFATALVELLRGVPAITTTAVYKLIQDTTRTAGSMKGHEERDAYFGRIFGFLALHRAGRLSVTSDSDAASVGSMPIGRIVGSIVAELSSLAVKKAWLAEVASEALAAIVPSVPQTLYAKYAHGPISNLIGATSSSGSAPAALVNPAHASLISATARLYTAGQGAGATPPYATLLSRAVEAGDFSPLRAAALAACHTYPHLHTFWRRVGDAFVQTGLLTDKAWHGVQGKESGAEQGAGCPLAPSPAALAGFTSFWQQCVDAPLLAPGASHERKATALRVFMLYLPHASPEVVGIMLSGPLLHAIKANARKRDNYLHQLARLALQALAGSVVSAGDAALATEVFAALNGRGHAQWDQATRSRVVSLCTHFLDEATLIQHLYSCMGQYLKGDSGARGGEGDDDAASSAGDEESPAAGEVGDDVDDSEYAALLALQEGGASDSEELDADLVSGLTQASDTLEVQRLWCVDAIASVWRHLASQDSTAASTACAHARVFLFAASLFRLEDAAAEAAFRGALNAVGPLPADALADGTSALPTPLVKGGTISAVAHKTFAAMWDIAAAAGTAAAAARAARRAAAGAAATGAGAAPQPDTESELALDVALATSAAVVQVCGQALDTVAALDAASLVHHTPPEDVEGLLPQALTLAKALVQAGDVLSEADPAALQTALGPGGDTAAPGLTRTCLTYGALLAAGATRVLAEPAGHLDLLRDLLTAAKPLLHLPLAAAASLAPAKPAPTPRKSKKTPKKAKKAAALWHGVPVSAWAEEAASMPGGDSLAVVVVAETLLGLLSNLGGGAAPGAGLVRESVKLAAGGLTPLLNAGAVEAVVSVLTTPLDDLAPAPAEEEEGTEGGDASDAGSEGSSSEGEEEEEDEEDESSDEEEEAGSASGSASGSADGGSEGGDAASVGGGSINTLPLPTPAEMQAMDRMVSGIIGMKQAGAAAAAAAKARREAALTFQFRASDVLDAWAARGAQSPSGALLLMPVLRALRLLCNRVRLAGGAHPSRGIVQRMTAVLHRLTGRGATAVLAEEDEPALSQAAEADDSAPEEEEEEEEEGDEVLEGGNAAVRGVGPLAAASGVEEALLLACGSPSAAFSSLAGAVAATLLRGMAAAGLLDPTQPGSLLPPVAAVLADATTSYLTHKNTKLNAKVFAPVWPAAPAVSAAALPAITHAITHGANAFRQAEAAALATTVLRAAGQCLPAGATLPTVTVNAALVGKRLDVALDGGVAPAPPAERLVGMPAEEVVGAAATGVASLLMAAAAAGHVKQPAAHAAPKLKELIAAAKGMLVAPSVRRGGSGQTPPATPPPPAREAVVQALSALYRCSTSGKVRNAAQSALSRLGEKPAKLDLTWFEGLAPATPGKAGKGTKRQREKGGAMAAKLQAAAAFADLAQDEEGSGEEAAPAAKPAKKAKKSKKARSA